MCLWHKRVFNKNFITLSQCSWIWDGSNDGSFHQGDVEAWPHPLAMSKSKEVFGQCHQGDHIPPDGFQFQIGDPVEKCWKKEKNDINMNDFNSCGKKREAKYIEKQIEFDVYMYAVTEYKCGTRY